MNGVAYEQIYENIDKDRRKSKCDCVTTCTYSFVLDEENRRRKVLFDAFPFGRESNIIIERANKRIRSFNRLTIAKLTKMHFFFFSIFSSNLSIFDLGSGNNAERKWRINGSIRLKSKWRIEIKA